MIYCRHCGSQIHETAVTCPSCGGSQILSKTSESSKVSNENTSWIAITSLILGILSLLVFFDDSEWDRETYIGVFSIFLLPSFILGVVALSNDMGGKNMATAGVIMSSIACLLLIGTLNA